MTTVNTMQLYHLTLHNTTAVTQAVSGQFTGAARDQLILTACGSMLTLYRVDSRAGRVVPVVSHDVFGIIRGIAPFRFAGTAKDYIVVTSDAGRIAVLEYNDKQNRFERKHLETFGKSGIRRVVPGQYLASDPKGRAVMLASIEKNKLVYTLSRNDNDIHISSPQEAHKAQSLVLALIAVDAGYDNPTFATIEVDYSDNPEDEIPDKQLVFYELDLGLNHVVRKWHDAISESANMLVQVPGGEDGPSGVLVCSEDNITYRHHNQNAHRVVIPRRKAATEDPSRKRHIVCGVMHRMKGAFFFLLQTEDGDLFKLTLELVRNDKDQLTGEVESLNIKYFDTVPLATSLVILKSGFLYVASENGDQLFYKFEGLGDGDEEDVYRSTHFPANADAPYEPVYFYPRPLTNLSLLHTTDGLNPMTSCTVENLTNEDAPQIYAISGSGSRSAFRILRNGLETTEVTESMLPGVPISVHTTKTKQDDEFDAYIILSFKDASLVLSIGDTVEEVSDSGLLTSCSTIAVQLLDYDSLVQVHARGLRMVKADGVITDWPCPPHRTIVAATTNVRQVCIALSTGELVYFEIDNDGSLSEYENMVKVDTENPSTTITTLSLGPVSSTSLRSRWLAVGCSNSTVRILRIDPDPEQMFQRVSLQALSAHPCAMKISLMEDPTTGGMSLYLHIGLDSGVYLRTTLDEITGELADTRLRFLGPRPVLLFDVTFEGKPAMLALSTRSWLAYAAPQTRAFSITPLDYVPLDWAASFTSHIRHEAIVGISGQELRIMYLEDLKSTIRREVIPLKNTPRAFSKHPQLPFFYVVESDQHTLPTKVRQQLKDDPSAVNGEVVAADLNPEQFGYPRGKGYWTSTIEIVDPIQQRAVIKTIELENNEAAFCTTTVRFSAQSQETFLIVGTVQNLVTYPEPTFQKGFVHVYRLARDGTDMDFIHKTSFDERPTALLPFRGRLLVAIGKELRVYDVGMLQLLQKTRARVAPNAITTLQTQGSRIIVTDIQEGPIFVQFKEEDNKLIPFADDTVSRWTTASTMMDYETVAGGDKFGNLWIVRCPSKASEEADEEGSAAHLVNERSRFGGRANKVNLLAHFYSQDIPTSVQKCQLLPGAGDVLVWGGLLGTIGVLIPFASKEDVEFFHKLELTLRREDSPLAGRDHLIYRSYYNPVKAVIDGDLCERYLGLPYDKKAIVAAELDRPIRDIEKKIADMRARYAF